MARGVFRADITVIGAKRVKAALKIRERRMKRVPRAASKAWGELAAKTMRSIAPRDQGELIAAIQAEPVVQTPKGDADVWVGPGGRTSNNQGRPYEGHVEYGTSRTPEQPYARPTARIMAKRGPKIVADAAREALR